MLSEQSVGAAAAKAQSPKVQCLVRVGWCWIGEEELEVDVLLKREPLEDMGATCFLAQVWVSRQAAEFWMYCNLLICRSIL